MAERFYAEDFGFLFDNTSIVVLSLYLHLSSLNLCHLISTADVILFGLDCFINFVLSLCSYSAHTLFDNKLELVICNLGV